MKVVNLSSKAASPRPRRVTVLSTPGSTLPLIWATSFCSGCLHGEQAAQTAVGQRHVWGAEGRFGSRRRQPRALPAPGCRQGSCQSLHKGGFCAGCMQHRALLKAKKKKNRKEKIEPIVWRAITISLLGQFIGEGWCWASAKAGSYRRGARDGSATRHC